MCGAERAGKREDPAAAVRFRGLRGVRALRRAWVCVAAMLGVAAQTGAQVAQDSAGSRNREMGLTRSPDKSIQVMLRVDGDGRPEYSIRRKDQAIVDWS